MRNPKRRSLLLLSATASSSLMISPAFALPIVPSASIALTPSGGSEQIFTNNDTPEASVGVTDGNVQAFGEASVVYTTRSDASVRGSGRATSSATVTESIFNNTGTIVDYFFTFRINRGELLLELGGASAGTGDTASAVMSALVTVNDAAVWSTGVGLNLSDSLYSISDDLDDEDDGVLSGFTSSLDDDRARLTWTATVFSVSLGTLNPSQSLEMDYTLSTAAFGDYATACIDEGEYGDGCYRAYAAASDPAGIDSTVLGISAVPRSTGTVPSPATLALMGIGLAGIGAARRRIRKHS